MPIKPFLETLAVQNLLSYGSEMQLGPMEPLTVMIGPNASGKSNLIEIISLLSSVPRELNSEIVRGGGIAQWLWKGDGKLSIGAIALVLVAADENPFYYRIVLQELGTRLNVAAEALGDGPPEEKGFVRFARLSHLGLGDAFCRYLHRRDKVRVLPHGNAADDRGRRPVYLNEKNFDPQRSIMSQLRDPYNYPEITELSNYFQSIRVYREWHLGPDSPVRKLQRADLPIDFLLEDGSNLGLVLNDFQNRRETWTHFQNNLRLLYPELDYLHTRVQGGYVEVMVHEKGMETPLHAIRLSDGTLRFMCLLAILCHPEPPPLICIEEPELGLHPDILPTVAKLLVDASRRTQLIVTTHSEILVSEFTDTPQYVVICENNSLGTRLRRLAEEPLKKWLQDYSLGELWTSGEIGGTRW
jgi:predicted ATPase